MSSFAFIKKFNPETIVDLPYSEAESIALLNGYKLCVWNGKELLPLEWSTREWELDVIYVTVNNGIIKTIVRTTG